MPNELTPIAVDGKRMRALRKERGFTADALGWHAGLCSRHIWRLETGTRQHVAAITLAAIARVLDTTIEYLLGLTDDPRSVTELIAAAGSVTEDDAQP